MVRRVIGGVAALGLGGCVLIDNPRFDGPATTGTSSGDASSSADATTYATTGMTVTGGSVTSVGSSTGTVDPVTGGTTATTMGGTPECGNGVQEGAEECDDGNAQGLDGCSASCHVEPIGLMTQDTSVLGPFGGFGGSGPISMECPGGVVSAFGGWLDEVQGLAVCKPTWDCSSISVDATLQIVIEKSFSGSYLGNCLSEVMAWLEPCPAGSALVGFDGTAVTLVQSLVPRCATLEMVEHPEGFAVERGAPVNMPGHGGENGMVFGPIDCPDGQVITKIKGNAQDGLHDLTIFCTQFVPQY